MNIKTIAQKAQLHGAIRALEMVIELLKKQQAVFQNQLEEVERED